MLVALVLGELFEDTVALEEEARRLAKIIGGAEKGVFDLAKLGGGGLQGRFQGSAFTAVVLIEFEAHGCLRGDGE